MNYQSAVFSRSDRDTSLTPSLQEPYTSGNGVYIADIFDCVSSPQSMANVKTAMEGVYDVHESVDGICCPNRGLCFCRVFFTWCPSSSAISLRRCNDVFID